MNDHNLKQLCLNEWWNLHDYLDRIHHAVVDVLSAKNWPTPIKHGHAWLDNFHLLLDQRLFSKPMHSLDRVYKKDMDIIWEEGLNLLQLVRTLCIAQFEGQQKIDFLCQVLNLNYQYAYKMHLWLDEQDVEIQLPRSLWAHERFEDHEEVPLYVFNAANWNIEQITLTGCLKEQREKRHREWIKEGHHAIMAKDYSNAKESFDKALNLKETAEAYTLVGWTCALKDDITLAKSFCLKAIKKDPSYGPPYNDLGTYLLNDGEVNESLKWFDMAKKATHYQNREYPYINSGRAYIVLKKYEQALEEFGHALTLAPHHEELHQTVDRLRQSLKEKQLNDYESFNLEV